MEENYQQQNNIESNYPQPNSGQSSPQQENYPKTYPKKSIWKWVLLYVLIGIVAYGAIYYFFFYKKGAYNYDSEQRQNTYSDQLDENIANWKSYINTEGGFALKYPPSWTLDDRTSEGSLGVDVSHKSVIFSGKQGRLQVDYGDGFGGMCEEGYEPLFIGSEKFDVCHSIINDTEYWSVAAKDFGKLGIGMFININKPYTENRDFLLKILSTFKFTNGTVDWKTYDSGRGFEIKYPPDAELNHTNISGGESITFVINSNQRKRTFEIQLITSPLKCTSASGADNSTVAINGTDFTKYYESKNYSGTVSTSAYKYCAVVDNRVVFNVIPRIESNNSFEADSDPILNEMLSTFRIYK